RARQAADVVFTIGQVYQDRATRLARATGGTTTDQAQRRGAIRAAWQDVVRHYTDWVNRYARNGTVDQRIVGNTALGRGYWNLGDHAPAQLSSRAAAPAWGAPPRRTSPSAPRPPTAGETAIRAELSASAAADAVEHARDAAAEARFYLA